jgi:hypothetical protein
LPDATNPLPKQPCYSPDEFMAAYRSLSNADLTRINLLARKHKYRTGWDHAELLHEAIARILDGKRKWPRTVPLIVFLGYVMQGIASHLRAQVTQDGKLRVLTDVDGVADETSPAKIERLVTLRQLYRRALLLLKDDPLAKELFIRRVRGGRGKELRGQLNLDRKQFETVRKRLRRKILGLLQP